MKKVVSVSIGTSLRDHKVETEFLGETYIVERIGTNGSIPRAIELIRQLDGKVDALGLGGIDLYLSGVDKRFMIKEAKTIVRAAKRTPIVDGTGLKNTLEKNLVRYLEDVGVVSFSGKRVLLVCAADRFKMAEAFVDVGCDIVMGDVMFALGIPFPIRSIKTFKKTVKVLLPIVSLLPYSFLYPTGAKQENKEIHNSRYGKYYRDADVIAGDFLYIKKNMPQDLTGKIMITNTVTGDDIDLLKKSGVKLLVTSTPELNGRSFGTNVMEAVLVAASGKNPDELSEGDYLELIKKLNFLPRIEHLN